MAADDLTVDPPGAAREIAPSGTSLVRVTAWLVLPLSLLLAPLSAALLYMVHRTGSHELFHTWNLLWSSVDIGAENSIGTWFASTLWLLIGAFASLAALTAPRLRAYWWAFAAIGIVASVDETATLHERLFVIGDRLAPFLPFDTFYNWVIPGALIAILVGLILIRLVIALHVRVTATLIGAGVLFLIGSLVIETLTGLIVRDDGAMNSSYVAWMYVEETFELLSVAVAVIALSSMFRVIRSANGLSVSFHGYRNG